MARTQINERGISDRSLTGASFVSEMKFYDETLNYAVDDIVIWQGDKYVALNAVIGASEGDLTNAPDVSANWKKLEPATYSVYATVEQSFTNAARTTVNFNTERVISPTITKSGPEFIFNTTGIFIISLELTTIQKINNNREQSYGYLQIDTGAGFADIPGFEVIMYNRGYNQGASTGSGTIALNVNMGDKIRAQVIGWGADTLNTVPDGCNLTIFANQSVSGPKGDKGDVGPVGPSGDLNWRGDYSSTATYNINDVVYYFGSSYRCNTNGTTGEAPDTSTKFELVAQKGADGSGAQINIADEGINIPNTPHGTINFIGMNAYDQGGGVAAVEVKKNSIAHCTNDVAQTFSNIAVAVNLANIIPTTDVSISGNTVTINGIGAYRIRYKITLNNTTSTRSNPHAYFEVNGTILNQSTVNGYSRNTTSGNTTMYYELTNFFNSGDQIIFYVANDVTANLTLTANDSYFEIEKLEYTNY